MGIGSVRGQTVYRQRWLNAYRDSQRPFRGGCIASGIVRGLSEIAGWL